MTHRFNVNICNVTSALQPKDIFYIYMNITSIDIFCHCVDNYGDAGVVYRFATELKIARPEYRVRVFIDCMTTINAIVKDIDPSKDIQEYAGITYINTASINQEAAYTLGVADVMVEAFACHIPAPLLELAYDRSRLIINLEHLSAEDWVTGCHLKESLLGRGSVRKYYFMPGLREDTGGLIINSRLRETRSRGLLDERSFINNTAGTDTGDNKLIGTIFTYERGFDTLLADLNSIGRETVLLVFGDKSQRGMSATFKRLSGVLDIPAQNTQHLSIHTYKNIHIIYMPFIDQYSYDTLLCCADFNIVRGEDSLARAILSGKPFVWNAYIQDNKYQKVKVKALLDTMRPYYESRGYSDIFNGYCDLMQDFNDAPAESPRQTTSERYIEFFENLQKHKHIASGIYYFIENNCNLVINFCKFLEEI